MEFKYLTVKEYIVFVLTCDLLTTLTASTTSGYLGCFNEDTVKEFTHIRPDPNPNGGTICKQMCADEGHRYAGTKKGNQCHCGTEFGGNATQDGCDIPCTENATEICGGKHHVSLYDTWKCATFPCKNNASCVDIDGYYYTCTCTDGWTGDSCEQQEMLQSTTAKMSQTTQSPIPDSISSLSSRVTAASIVTDNVNGDNEKPSLIAAYVAVPVAVILTLSAVAVCIIWRKRKAKYGSEAIDDSLPVASMTNAACTAHAMNHITDTTQCGDMSGSNDDYYAEIPLDNINYRSDVSNNEYNTIELRPVGYNVPDNSYGHLIKGTAPFVDIAYSHTDKYPTENESGTMDNTYSHIGNEQTEVTVTQRAVDGNDTYNVLQTKPYSKENKETKQNELDKDGDSVYDHAFAGSQNKTNDDVDEYSHSDRNMNTTQSHIQREDQDIVVLKDTDVIYKEDLVEQAVGISPHYCVLQSEDQSFAGNDKSGTEESTSHVDVNEYEDSSKHVYLVLENTNSNE